MSKKSSSITATVLPIAGVAAMMGGIFYLTTNYGGFDSIGAFEYIEGERDVVLYYGFHKGEESRHDYQEALLRDAKTGEHIAKTVWPENALIVARSDRYIWVKVKGGFALYDAKTLGRILDHDTILQNNPFLGTTVSRAYNDDDVGKFPQSFDAPTGRLLVQSGKGLYVLAPDGKALALEDAQPAAPVESISLPKDGPCGRRNIKVSRICGVPSACIETTEPGKYGKVSLVFHGTEAKAAEKPAEFYEPTIMQAGRGGYCVDRLDDAGSVLVQHKTSPQEYVPTVLSLVRPDGTEAWSVPIESFGKEAGLDLAVRAGGEVRVYGSLASDTIPITGDYGLLATLDMASGAASSTVVFRK